MAAKARQKHVLVINDSPAILDLFRELLDEAGYRATTHAFSGQPEQKLAEIKEVEPDLVILDYLIGGEALGWQLLQLLKLDRTTRDLPVIVCTGAVQQVKDMEAHLLEMGVSVVLKPFDIDQLLAEIDRVWERLGETPPARESA